MTRPQNVPDNQYKRWANKKKGALAESWRIFQKQGLVENAKNGKIVSYGAIKIGSGGLMWILELIGEIFLEALWWLAPRDTVWYWVIVALVICVIIGLGIYFVR